MYNILYKACYINQYSELKMCISQGNIAFTNRYMFRHYRGCLPFDATKILIYFIGQSGRKEQIFARIS